MDPRPPLWASTWPTTGTKPDRFIAAPVPAVRPSTHWSGWRERVRLLLFYRRHPWFTGAAHGSQRGHSLRLKPT